MPVRDPSNQFFPILREHPSDLLPWLNHQGSLTQKLQTCSSEVRLEVLRQGWDSSNWWDQHVLQHCSGRVFHRDILILGDATPCWFARTIIPQATFYRSESFFNRLKKESLSALIFDEPKVKRVEMIPYFISNQTIEFQWLPKNLNFKNEVRSARLSAFQYCAEDPFYLVEIFLPGIGRFI